MKANAHLSTRQVSSALICLLLPACGSQLVYFPYPPGSSTTTPSVISTSPAASAIGIDVATLVTATFNLPMDPTSLDRATFNLTIGGSAVSGSITYEDGPNTATFAPDYPLAINEVYTATITTGARDTQGAPLAASFIWTFTCGSIQVGVATATAQDVPAPDYALDMSGLVILTDTNNVVSSATGSAELTAGSTAGQQFVIVDGGGLQTYAAIDGAYLSRTESSLSTTLAAAEFDLVGVDLTTPQVRTIIIANIVSGVRSYQAFEITLDPAG